jgi:hypothetical protein
VNGFVASGYMLGFGIGIRVDRHGLNAHSLGCGCYTTGNFAAVGNENFCEHDQPANF